MDEPKPAITAELVESRYEALMKQYLHDAAQHPIEQKRITEIPGTKFIIRYSDQFTVETQPDGALVIRAKGDVP